MELLYHLSYFGLLLTSAFLHKELLQGSVFWKDFQSHAVFILVHVQFTQRMRETETTPWQWLRETWESRPFEFLLPAGCAVALAQFLTAVFALRSGHRFLLLLVMAATAFALLRTVALLVRISQEYANGVDSRLSKRDLWELFAPQLAALVLYVLIAPGVRFELFFAAISLPHLLLLGYIARRYAAEALPVLQMPLPRIAFVVPAIPRSVPLALEMIGAPALQLVRAVKTAVVSAWSVEKIPQIG